MNLPVELLNEIDKRVNRILEGKDILCRTSAKVISVDYDHCRAQVIFYGDSKKVIHTFPIRQNGLFLQPNDCVFVESKLHNLNTGIITDKLFGIEEEN
jgi:hypothetical protein